MKKHNRDIIEDLINRTGEESAKEYEKYTGEERPILEDKLLSIIFSAGDNKTNKKRQIIKPKILLAVILVTIFFVGAGYQLARNYLIRSSTTHNSFLANSVEFYNLPSFIPDNYILLDTISTNSDEPVKTMVFHNREIDTYINFTEANYNLTVSTDGEDVVLEFVSINNRYEGTLTHKKDGAILVWEQDGYFYILTINNGNLSADILIKIASSLKTNQGVY